MIYISKRTATIIILVTLIVGIFASSLPELIGGFLAAILFVAVVCLFRKWRIANPLDLQFSIDPIKLPPGKWHREQTNKIQLKKGKRDVLLRVMPKAGTNFDRIGIRFAKRRWLFGDIGLDGKRHYIIHRREGRWRILWDWDNVPVNIISISKVFDAEMNLLQKENNYAPHQLRSWNDYAGGIWAQYEPPYPRTKEDSLWIQIEVKAKIPCNLHISFQGSIGEHRAYKRRTVEVIN